MEEYCSFFIENTDANDFLLQKYILASKWKKKPQMSIN